jgi:hypothetical protein
MKRRALALCSGLLLLGLMPGATLAIAPPSYLDQSTSPNLSDFVSSPNTVAQTFTAGGSGPLSEVDLYMGGAATVSVTLEGVTTSSPPKPDDSNVLATSDSITFNHTGAAGWVPFSFSTPPSVTSGHVYAIVIDLPTTSPVNSVFASTDPYAGGGAWRQSSGWTTGFYPNLAFQTYLEETITTTVAWDKPQVTAGTGTALKLTVTIAFGNDGEADHYTVLLGALPSWYTNPTPPTIACSWGACALVTIQGIAGITIPASNPGATLTVTLQGTANPATADIGTPGTAHGTGCILRQVLTVVDGPQPAAESSLCSDGTASVAVVAAEATPTPAPTTVVQGATAPPTRAPTPPPTSTGAGPGSDNTGGTIWFLSFALIAFFGGLLVLVDRRRRRLF